MPDAYPSHQLQQLGLSFLDKMSSAHYSREEARQALGQLLIDAYREGYGVAKEKYNRDEEDFPLGERQCNADGESCESCQ